MSQIKQKLEKEQDKILKLNEAIEQENERVKMNEEENILQISK